MISGLYLDPGSSPIGRVVAVVSARGGAGSSTLAHNIGRCIAEELHINTTIVDLDLPFGTVGLDFNDEASQGVADALSAPERLDDVLLDRLLLKRGDHLSLFTAPAALERDYDALPESYEAVIDAVRQSTPCVILDLPTAGSPGSRPACGGGRHHHRGDARPDRAAQRQEHHRAGQERAAQRYAAQAWCSIRWACPSDRKFHPRISPRPWAWTRRRSWDSDPALFGQAANNGQMVIEVSPKAPVSESVRRLCRALTGRAVQVANKFATSIFSFLKGKKASLTPFRQAHRI